MKHEFRSGAPACPVACRYCFITEHDLRREVWNKNPIAGLNKACTFINVPPWIAEDEYSQKQFREFPWEILKGDFVGFTAITDPFFPKIDKYLWEWVEKASPFAKLLTCVSKWPISRKTMEKLSSIPNFYLVLGITGNGGLERVSMSKHLETLSLAKEYEVPCLPIAHPYIAGVSDLWFLPEIKNLGYEFFDVKGLRYCASNMAKWMPESSKHWYEGKEDLEILPEDGWRDRVAEAGLSLLSPRQWYGQQGLLLSPKLDRALATELVAKVADLANIVTSGTTNDVIRAAIDRRL